MHDLGFKRGGEGGDGGKGESTEDVGGKDGGPETEGLPEVVLFGEDEGDGIESVFGEELGATEDDYDEAEGVEHLADEEDGVRGNGAGRGEQRDGDGVAEGGETHEDAAGEAGDGEGNTGAAEFLTGVVGDLFVDILGAGTFEILLRVLRGGGLGWVAA